MWSTTYSLHQCVANHFAHIFKVKAFANVVHSTMRRPTFETPNESHDELTIQVIHQSVSYKLYIARQNYMHIIYMNTNCTGTLG